jgi:DNA repair exonuclease SbcCD ATPase subunit
MPRKQPITPDLSSLPMKTEVRCNVCNSPMRNKVDKLVAAQFSYTSIAEELVESDPAFKGKELDTVRKNVERHAKRHLDIRNKAIRQIVEQRAREQGMLLDQVEGKIVSGRALLDLIVNRGTEQLTDNPDFKVKMQDALEAVKMLEDVQKAEFQAQLETMQRQVWAISEALKTIAGNYTRNNQVIDPSFIPSVVNEAHRLFEMEAVAPALEK